MWEDLIVHAAVGVVLGLSSDPNKAKILMPVLTKLRDALNELYPASFPGVTDVSPGTGASPKV